jgi:hypothetical protein
MSSPDLTAEPRRLRRANDVIDTNTLKPPAALFDEFWREGEVAMLFGAAGAGKSLLAVQIGDALARGRPIDGFEMPTTRRNVLHVDLVLSDEQFAMRYSRETRKASRRAYKFSAGFYRDRPADGERLSDWFRAIVAAEKIRVVIIDDLSVISQSDDGTRETLELMREVRRMTRELGVSVLVLADSHPLIYEREVAERDLRRNRVLCAFADSVFAIQTASGDRRVLVQTRCQSSEPVWTHRSPVRLDLAARDDGSVGFEREELTDEQRKRIIQIKEMHDEGDTFREIADALSISKSTAARLYAKWTPRMESERGSEGEWEDESESGGESERYERDFPGCEEYDDALDDPRFDDVPFDKVYEHRLLHRESYLIELARADARRTYEETGVTPRLNDHPKYKEFLECVAAGRDPWATRTLLRSSRRPLLRNSQAPLLTKEGWRRLPPTGWFLRRIRLARSRRAHLKTTPSR